MPSFQGLNREQWALIKPLFPKPSSSKFCRKDLSPKKVMNTILWVLITGARWIDVPVGPRWAARSTAHEWLGHWQRSGLLERVLNLLLEKADSLKLTGFDRLKVDGFFSQGRGGGEEVGYGYKGKGVTNHLLVDTLGNPIAIKTTAANISERDQVIFLLQKINRFVKPLI